MRLKKKYPSPIANLPKGERFISDTKLAPTQEKLGQAYQSFAGIRLIDTSELASEGSRSAQYWAKRGMFDFITKLRPKFDLSQLPDPNPTLPQKVVDRYHLKDISYGNWLTTEDRYNYTYALFAALSDLDKVLQFNNNLGGSGNLGVSIGGRGRGGAVAHFESWSNIVNMTRYKRDYLWRGKGVAFVTSGGLGAFAHEYGHFLDYFCGSRMFPDHDNWSLTGGRSHSVEPLSNDNKHKARDITNNILLTVHQVGNYYANLNKLDNGEYFRRRNEIFARCFESYIAIKLKQKNIENYFLVQDNYEQAAYPPPDLMKQLVPLFDDLMSEIRKA